MAPVQSRLVLTWSLPALAVVLGLLWLKRRRRRGSIIHSPIPDTKDISQQDVDINQEEDIEEKRVLLTSFATPELFNENIKHDVLSVVSNNIKDLNLEDDKQLDELCENIQEIKSTSDVLIKNTDCVSEGEDKTLLRGKVDNTLKALEKVLDTAKIRIDFLESIVDEVNDKQILEIVNTDSEFPEVQIDNNKQLLEIANSEVQIEKKENKIAEEKVIEKIDYKSTESNNLGNMKEETKTVNVVTEKVSDPVVTDIVQKLSNLELSKIKIDEIANNNCEKETTIKNNGERDSANHSPSEIMLASPSVASHSSICDGQSEGASNFSDAHSEGSSDSGKGHSELATTPPRTPAGGSSVAGESAPILYEFILPQLLVGRLIGRHGSYLHELMTETNTNIIIKPHPETTDVKICCIEGSQQQEIDKALIMIRQKFPLRRFPKLTLERLYSDLSPQLNPELFHLQLIEGMNNDVLISSLVTAGHFFVQLPSHQTYPCLTNLTYYMTSIYSSPDVPQLQTQIIKDIICAAPSMGGWYRCQVIDVDEKNEFCDIKFLDYGGFMRIKTSELRQIRIDCMSLAFQAIECHLADVMPISEDGCWSETAKIFVHNLTYMRLLQAVVVSYTEEGIPLINLYSSMNDKPVLVNEELVNNGFAVKYNIQYPEEPISEN